MDRRDQLDRIFWTEEQRRAFDKETDDMVENLTGKRPPARNNSRDEFMPNQRSSALFESSSDYSSSNRVDVSGGIVRNVKLLGLESKNGRTYVREGVARAITLYEGVACFIDHAKTANQSRSYSERFGMFKNVRLVGDELRGDHHCNPKHPMSEAYLWDAKHNPKSVGMSHNVHGRTSTKNGRTIVESIEKVHSVDLVLNPATTAGLFESLNLPSPIIERAAGGGTLQWLREFYLLDGSEFVLAK